MSLARPSRGGPVEAQPAEGRTGAALSALSDLQGSGKVVPLENSRRTVGAFACATGYRSSRRRD